MEKWKKIEGFDNIYSINRNGNVRNDKSGRILKTTISTSGYPYLQLRFENRNHTKYIHRLLGEAFIDNPLNLPQIDHIDGCKTNNNLSNLRWISVSDNCLSYGSEQRAKNRKRPVFASHSSGRTLTFDSRKETAEHFGCSPTKIRYNHLYKKGSKKGWSFQQI